MTSSARARTAGGMIRPRALAGLEIDPELERRRLLDRHLSRLGSAHDAVHEDGGPLEEARQTGSVRDQTPGVDERGRGADRRQLVLQSEASNLSPVAHGQDVVDDDEDVRPPAGSFRHSRFQIIGVPDGHRGDVEADLRRGGSRLLERDAGAGIALVPENRDAPRLRHHFADDLDLFLAEPGDLIGHPSRVTSRPRQTGDQTGADGIGRHRHHDGN